MSLSTYSVFFYGHTVTNDDQYFDIDEGSGPLVVKVPVGSYTFSRFLEIVSQTLNAVGTNNYTVTADRATRLVNISSDAPFDLLGATGNNVSRTILPLLGFPIADVLATSSVTGTSPTGFAYYPQLPLQDHIPTEKSFRALSATVSKSASGNRVSVQTFGQERFLKCNIKFITDIPQPGNSRIRTDSTAIENVLAFLNYITTKAPIEFMVDENDLENFQKFILETTEFQSDGTGYELKEYYDKKLPYYFETGPLSFKVIEE